MLLHHNNRNIGSLHLPYVNVMKSKIIHTHDRAPLGAHTRDDDIRARYICN